MIVLPHALEINDFERAMAVVTNALNTRDAVFPVTDWPEDINARIDAVEAYIVAELDALRPPVPPSAIPYTTESKTVNYVAES